MELTEFLLARIAEDEGIARRATGPVWVMGVDREGGPGRWRHVAQLVALPAADPLDTLSIGDELLRAEHGDDSARAFRSVQHVVRWDPARVLAKCAADRQVVEEARRAWARSQDDDPLPEGSEWLLGQRWGLRTALHYLALPYADHPDYREEWKP